MTAALLSVFVLPALAAPWLHASARPRLVRRTSLAIACGVLAWSIVIHAENAIAGASEASLSIGGVALVVGGARSVLASVVALVAVGALAFAPRRSIDGRAASADLLAETGSLLALHARDPALVVAGWAMSAWPLLGGAHHRAATQLARVTIAISIALALAAFAGLPWSWAFALAALARLGVPPFHSFAIAALHRAPPWAAVIAIVSPLPLLALGLEPATPALSNVLLAAGVAGAVYASVVALVQNELRRALAYVHVSVVSSVVASMGSGTGEGIAGALLAGVSATLAIAGLVFVAGVVEARTGTGDMRELGGLHDRLPLAAAAFLLFAFAAVGFPGTLGFVSEDLAMQGLAPSHPALAVVVLVASAVNGITLYRCWKRTFLGPARESTARVGALVTRERITGFAWAFVLVLGGLVPAPLSAIRESLEHTRPPVVDRAESAATAPAQRTTSTRARSK